MAEAASTRVISNDGPSPAEERHELSLSEWCATRREPEEESERRRNVLSRLQNIMRMWIRSIMVTEFRVPAELAGNIEGRLFTTGSYRYNVHGSGSDIDMVLIAPERVTREHFFSSLLERLRNEPWITQLDPIPDARVPIIAMKADGVDIDLSFGAIKRSQVPEIITDDILRGLDESSVRSCNAVRVASAIIEMVPNKGAFRQALRFIKAWGKERGVYNLKLGFPSGIGWALLVAKACQNYPKKNATGVLCRFFRVYSEWFRPDPHITGRPNRAIYLTESLTPAINLGPCWDPRNNQRDAQALFPVITPANPYSNACYNVSVTTLRVLCKEFQRGNDILSQYVSQDPEELKKQYGPFGVWKHLLEPYPFFTSHTTFLWVKVSCTNAKQYTRYVDAVETKISLLWAENQYTRGFSLESYPQVEVRVYSSRFEDPEEVRLREAIVKSEKTGAPMEIVVPATQLYTAHFLCGLDVHPPAPGQQQKKIDLSKIVTAFLEQVKQMKVYEPPVTRLPVVEVVKADKLPRWISGCEPKRPREDEEAVATPLTGGASSTPASSLNNNASPSTTGDVMKPVGTSGIAPASSSTAKPKAVTAQAPPSATSQRAELDEALGMDF